MLRPTNGRAFSATQKPEESRDAMTDLEKMKQWLQTYPGLEELSVDYVEDRPGQTGLFFQGMEELSRRKDILGNCWIACRYRFILQRKVLFQQDLTAEAQWLLEFQNWVQQQCLAGLAPKFGDEEAGENILAQKGSLQGVSSQGIATYTVTLVADFEKVYWVS